jgi:DNA-binding NarL/FixJ family response regulator
VLTEALRLVLVGGTYVPPQALRAVTTPKPPQGGTPPAPASPTSTPIKSLGLTPRQVDVLTLLVQGKPNKLICRTLNLAEGTVKTHTAAIYRALGVMNRTRPSGGEPARCAAASRRGLSARHRKPPRRRVA